jgi:hypothetical protein
MRAHLIISIALATAACGNHKEVEAAKHSLYDTDFAIVFGAALEATRALYPNLEEHPAGGSVQTAWHQVQYASDGEDLANPTSVQQGATGGGTSQASQAAGMPTRLAYKRYYIRFDVKVAGGRPWRVKVKGHAASWEPGAAMPVELHGIAKPAWLEPRVEALEVSIWKRVKPYAVPMKAEDKAQPEDELPRTDPALFSEVPTAAAKRLAQLKDAASRRDFNLLRPQVYDDVKWSLGAEPGADVALAMWQADPDTLEGMARAIGAACVSGDDKKTVKCPAQPKAGEYQLVLELRGDAWKLASYLKNE